MNIFWGALPPSVLGLSSTLQRCAPHGRLRLVVTQGHVKVKNYPLTENAFL
jgi:hypothetical protein